VLWALRLAEIVRQSDFCRRQQLQSASWRLRFAGCRAF